MKKLSIFLIYVLVNLCACNSTVEGDDNSVDSKPQVQRFLTRVISEMSVISDSKNHDLTPSYFSKNSRLKIKKSIFSLKYDNGTFVDERQNETMLKKWFESNPRYRDLNDLKNLLNGWRIDVSYGKESSDLLAFCFYNKDNVKTFTLYAYSMSDHYIYFDETKHIIHNHDEHKDVTKIIKALSIPSLGFKMSKQALDEKQLMLESDKYVRIPKYTHESSLNLRIVLIFGMHKIK